MDIGLPQKLLAWMSFSAIFAVLCVAELPADPPDVPSSTLDLMITSSLAEPPSRIYVAAVTEDHPWSEPARETVLEGSSALSWRLPPGRYRLVVGAPDHVTFYSPVIDLGAQERHLQEVELLPFAHVSGRVVDLKGSPIVGARIGRLRAFLDDFSRRLSPRGEETLAGNFLRRTSSDGTFELPVHPSAGQFLWVEAEHRAPRLLRNVRWAGAGSTLGKITLGSGGALEVQWKGADPRASDGMRLQLVPERSTPLGSITLRDARAVWERSARSGSASWPSLPPGAYDLWLKGPPYAAHRLVPHRVGRFEVVPGATTSRVVDLPEMGPPGPGPTEQLKSWESLADASLFLPGVHLAQLGAITAVRWTEAGPVDLTSTAPTSISSIRAEETSGGTRVDLARACREGSVFLVLGTDLIGVSKQLEAHSCERPIRLSVSARSTLKGRFLAPRGEQLPQRGQIFLRPCGSGSAPAGADTRRAPTAIIPVSLTREGVLSSAAPAGCFEVAASISRFAVTEWTAVELPIGGVGTLPVTRLLPGGAILARIVSGRDGLGLEGIRARAVQEEELSGLYSASARAGSSSPAVMDTPLVGLTSSDGWVRLYGLRAGTWRVALTDGERTYPHVSLPITVRGPEEVVLDPLELPPPASMTVQVDVGSSFDDALAEPAQVHARGADPSQPQFQLQIDAPLDSARIARLGEVPPGRWTISGLVRLDSGRLFPAGEKKIEVPAGENVRTKLVLDEPLFRGLVTWHGDPVEGALVLTPLPHDGRRKITVKLHEDGTFTVPLERAGTYRAAVTSLDGRIVGALVSRVEFDEPGDEVEIALPTGQIAGLVLDPEGRPDPSSIVAAESVPDRSDMSSRETHPRALRRRAHTDKDGAFVFEGLSPGKWTLRATREDLASDRRQVDLRLNEERNGLLLALGEPSTVELLVTSPGVSPAAGVQVLAIVPPSNAGGAPETYRGVTDENGVIAIERPEPPDLPVNLMLRGPSGLVSAKRTVLQQGSTVSLDSAASELRMRVARHEAAPSPWIFLIAENGAYLNPRWDEAGVYSEDGESEWLVVPRLANGHWRVVVPASAEDLFLVTTGRGLDLAEAASVTLDGTPTTVDLYDR